ncbi:MAG: sodium:calcium antiporter [Proteobacteria bacterium]|nr:sodium:calcium antiporter [Pseudomonadota bacterium]
MLLWIEFVICSSVIVYSGSRLSKYGDIIAEKTGLGGTWIGVVLMSFVTSLPELVTGISSVSFAGLPDIAAGDVLGSCVFNLFILAFLDALYRPMPLSAKALHGHILSAGFGILLLSIVALNISYTTLSFPFGWIGSYSLFFVMIYFMAMKLVYSYERRQAAMAIKERVVELKYGDISTKTAVSRYAIHAAIVIAAAVFLPKIGEGIAKTTGLGQTFVGNIFIAMSTSLPEVAVSIAAVRIGAIDLAVGNLLGSNIFNIFILAVDDIFFTKGPILSFTDPVHAVSAMSAVSMTAIAIIGLTYRAEKKRLFMAWDSIGITLIFVINLTALFMLR